MNIENNQTIQLLVRGIKSIDGDVCSDISLQFSTQFDPMLSLPVKVRELIGAYIEDITDDALNQLIFKYSIEVLEGVVCDPANSPKWSSYASRWVALKTAITALINSTTFVGKEGGKVFKSLGDFSFSKTDTASSGPESKVLEKLECEVFKLSMAVKYCREPLLTCDKNIEDLTVRSPAQGVTKGETYPGRPDFGRTLLKIGTMPGWNSVIKTYDRIAFSNFKK